MSEKIILQPSEIFQKLRIKHSEENERILDLSLKFLTYLKPGEKIKVGMITYTKLDSNTVYMDAAVNTDDLAEVLETKRIIRIPT